MPTTLHIDLNSSLNVSENQYRIRPIANGASAPVLKSSVVHENGGLTNQQYRSNNPYAPNASYPWMIAQDGSILDYDSTGYNLRKDGVVVHNYSAPPFGVKTRGRIPYGLSAIVSSTLNVICILKNVTQTVGNGSVFVFDYYNIITKTVVQTVSQNWVVPFNITFVMSQYYSGIPLGTIPMIIGTDSLGSACICYPGEMNPRLFDHSESIGSCNDFIYHASSNVWAVSFANSCFWGGINTIPNTGYAQAGLGIFLDMDATGVIEYRPPYLLSPSTLVFGARLTTTSMSSLTRIGTSMTLINAFSMHGIALATVVDATTLSNTGTFSYTSQYDAYLNQGNHTVPNFDALLPSSPNTPNFSVWLAGIGGYESFLYAKSNNELIPITNVGDISDKRRVDIATISSITQIIYLNYEGEFCYLQLGALQPTDSFGTWIDERNMLINNFSEFNIYNGLTNQVEYGVTAFHGSVLGPMNFTTEPSYNIFAFKKKANNAAVIDTGYQSLYASGVSDLITFTLNKGLGPIEVYNNTSYLASLYRGLYTYDSDLVGTLYQADTHVPIAIGYQINNRLLFTESQTILLGSQLLGNPDLIYDYAGYAIGNDQSGVYNAFTILGQQYIFDGSIIYAVTRSGEALAAKTLMCYAVGFRLLDFTPTVAYFISDFDNSLWAYTGGRSLNKITQLNNYGKIIQGVYSLRDECMLFDFGSTINYIKLRGGIFSLPLKASVLTTGETLIDTQAGLMAFNESAGIYVHPQMGYESGANYVAAFDWQSPYYGVNHIEKTSLIDVMVSLNAAPATVGTITLTVWQLTESGPITNTASFTTANMTLDSNGNAQLRIRPSASRALGHSIEVACTGQIQIQDIAMTFNEDVKVSVSASQSA